MDVGLARRADHDIAGADLDAVVVGGDEAPPGGYDHHLTAEVDVWERLAAGLQRYETDVEPVAGEGSLQPCRPDGRTGLGNDRRHGGHVIGRYELHGRGP